jgi:hypothetical protein
MSEKLEQILELVSEYIGKALLVHSKIGKQ